MHKANNSKRMHAKGWGEYSGDLNRGERNTIIPISPHFLCFLSMPEKEMAFPVSECLFQLFHSHSPHNSAHHPKEVWVNKQALKNTCKALLFQAGAGSEFLKLSYPLLRRACLRPFMIKLRNLYHKTLVFCCHSMLPYNNTSAQFLLHNLRKYRYCSIHLHERYSYYTELSTEWFGIKGKNNISVVLKTETLGGNG